MYTLDVSEFIINVLPWWREKHTFLEWLYISLKTACWDILFYQTTFKLKSIVWIDNYHREASSVITYLDYLCWFFNWCYFLHINLTSSKWSIAVKNKMYFCWTGVHICLWLDELLYHHKKIYKMETVMSDVDSDY